MELIYHTPETKNNYSNFDKSITKIVDNEKIKIACPYIGISYLKEAIISKCKDFQLITDINALFYSLRNKDDINSTLSFIEENKNKIRHYSNLHSKAIISNKQALFGSSNFTYSGINRNNELSVLINEPDKVKELSNWFDSWWQFSAEINIEELKKKIKSYKPKQDSTSSNELFIANNNIINCIYNKPKKSKKESYEVDEDFLKNVVLKHYNDKEWLLSFCSLAKHILTKFNISNDNNRLCITCCGGRYQIAITIGQRYIIYPLEKKEPTIDLIMPLDFDKDNAKKQGLYKATYFTNHTHPEAAWCKYTTTSGSFSLNTKTITEWETAVEKELYRTKNNSGYRYAHQPILYSFIMDEKFRNRILNEVYNKKEEVQ